MVRTLNRTRITALSALVAALAPAGVRADPVPVPVVDLHVDLPWQLHFKGRGLGLTEGHATADALRRGGYAGVVLPIYLPDKAHADGAHIDDAEAILATIERLLGQGGVFARPGAAPAAGQLRGFLSIEGASAFAADVTAIDRFIARGVRLIGVVHAKNGALASSATDAPTGYGLTPVGKAFCRRVYERGALIDVSHASDAAFADIADIAREFGAPLVASHSNARAVADHPRNLPDAALRAIAASGGVVGANFHAPFVAKKASATLDDLARQIEHMLRVAGVEHVAIGSDLDGGIRLPAGLTDAGSLPRLAAVLRARGLDEPSLRKLFAENALRVLLPPPPRPCAPAP